MIRWKISKRTWVGTFGAFNAYVYQHEVDGRKWSARVFDTVLPELYDTKEAAQEGAETYAWITLNAALRSLKPR